MTRLSTDKRRGQILTVCIVALVIGFTVWLWEDVLEDRLIPKRWGVVEEGKIYRSGRLSAALAEETLENHHIKVIVDLTGENPHHPDELAQKAAADFLGIEVKRFPLAGNGTGDVSVYAEAVEAVAQAVRENKPVQVHCVAGTQRTGGVIACYRLLVQDQVPENVLNEIERYGWDYDENPDLIEYVNTNLPTIARHLKEEGIIPTIPEPMPQLPKP